MCILIGVAICLIILATTEIYLHFTDFQGNHFRSILFGDDINSLLLFEKSPLLWWKLRKNTNVMFLNKKHATDASGFRACKNNTNRKNCYPSPRIICLGDSCTFGWRTNCNETYPFLLEKQLRTKYKNAQVYNAGVPGYTSFQTLLMFKYIVDEIRPHIAVIYTSNNECSASTYSDKDRYKMTSRFVDFRLLLNESLTYQFIKSLIIKEERSFIPVGNTLMDKQFELPPRVTPTEYRKNLIQLFRMANQKEVKLIVVSVPSHIRKTYFIDFPSKNRKVNFLLNLAKEQIHNRDYDASLENLLKAESLDPYYYKIHFLKGGLFHVQNRSDKISEYEKALEYHPFPDRLKKSYNNILLQTAEEYKIDKIDLYNVFIEHAKGLDRLFVDQCHPSSQGYKLIADQLYRRLADMLDDLVKENRI